MIAAAGFGTRFLPQTKAMPKEMLPLVDKPIIQHIVEELVDAGIEDIIIVTGYHKRAIEDHFDHSSAELRASLKQAGKLELLEQTRKISQLANFAYVRQKGPYGTGTPLLSAAHLIGDEPFIYTFADDFVLARPSRFRQLIDTHIQHGGSVLTGVRRDGDEDYKRFGYVGGKQISPGLTAMDTIIEKPGSREQAPSSLASVSGYLLEPTILSYLEQQLISHSGEHEFHIQDSMQAMVEAGDRFYVREIPGGKHYDTGNPLEYLQTVVDFALKHDETKEAFMTYLKNLPEINSDS